MNKLMYGMILILFIMIFSIFPTFADDEEPLINESCDISAISPNYVNIRAFYVGLDINGSGLATFNSFVDASGVDECTLIVYLQQYINGNWSTIKSWSKTENGSSCELSSSYFVAKGYLYRTKTDAYLYYDGALIESASIISSTCPY